MTHTDLRNLRMVYATALAQLDAVQALHPDDSDIRIAIEGIDMARADVNAEIDAQDVKDCNDFETLQLHCEKFGSDIGNDNLAVAAGMLGVECLRVFMTSPLATSQWRRAIKRQVLKALEMSPSPLRAVPPVQVPTSRQVVLGGLC